MDLNPHERALFHYVCDSDDASGKGTATQKKHSQDGCMYFQELLSLLGGGGGLLTAQKRILLLSSRVEVCVFTLKTHTPQLTGMSPSYSLTSACKTTCSNLFASCEKCSNVSLLLSPLQAKHVLLHYVLVSKAKAAVTDPV